MAEKFLRNIAKDFAGRGISEIYSVTFVFPNRRSSLFFKKYLSEQFDKPIFSPKILTISELFDSLYTVRAADKLTLLSILYQEWIKLTQKEGEAPTESLDDFISWGGLLLSDFSDVDSYLADAHLLFKNTAEYKELSDDFSWMDFKQQEAAKRIADIKSRFVDYWNILFDLYTSFRERLKEKGLCYPAMQYRAVAEAVIKEKKSAELSETEKGILSNLSKIERIAFIGFSAPTNCEKEVMRYFNRGGKERKGLFYWDYFSDFIKDKENKSSFLIDNCVQEFKNEYKLQDAEKKEIEKTKLINAYPVIGMVQQTLAAGKILEYLHKIDPDGINTAVVVSDENLLLPMLGAVPGCYKNKDGSANVNVTMGYPLVATPVYSLLRSLMRLVAGASLRNNNGTMAPCFETNALIRLLDSNYLNGKKEVSDALEELKKSKSYYTFTSDPSVVSIKELSLPQPFIDFLGTRKVTPELMPSVLDYYLSVLAWAETGVAAFERDCFCRMADAICSLKNLNLDIVRIRTLNSLLTSAVKSITINFKGEPLKGLQIMGPLETRLLDFDNVVFLSFNDGIFPASGDQSSAIPYSIRAHFGLPTYEFKDSVSAYNFYRLSQRAKRLYCIYDTEKTENGGVKEESRFLKQLKYGFSQKVHYHPSNFNYVSSGMEKGAEYPKNESLKDIWYSASMLNTYFECPLKFYLNKVKGLDEQEDLDDSLDSSAFGTLFHAVMEKIYEPYNNEVVTSEMIKALDPTDKLIEDVFKKELKVTEIDRENIVIKSLIKKYVKDVLKRDLLRIEENGEFTYIKSEKKMKVNLFGYNFIAYIDRIDTTRGKVLISDYKTGTYKAETLTAEKFVQKSSEEILDAVFDYSGNRKGFYANLFQLLLYALILTEDKKSCDSFNFSGGLQVTLYQLQKILTTGFNVYDISPELLKGFKGRLEDFIKRINSSAPGCWERKVDSAGCSYCPFKSYCLRKRV